MAARPVPLAAGSVPRLSLDTLASLPADVERPRYDVATLATGQVHLGVGAFMRAHGAVYTDEAIESDGGQWGIAGVSLRQPTVREQLQPQDCLYTVATRDNEGTARRLIGAIRSIHVAPEDPRRVVGLIADSATRIVTITVTEKGYCLAPDSGALDAANADVAHDIANPQSPRSMPGFLVAAMQERRTRDSGPLTVVACDNLPDNGARLRKSVLEFADLVDGTLGQWIGQNVRFPATMVDRIVPATTDDDLTDCEAALGLRDEAMVKTEPFKQWVIEDDFASERPAWETAGALLVDDVEPYESTKLRLLNGPHSALAYLGYLAGHETISDVVADRAFARYARRLMLQEISPVTPQPPGMQHGPYIDALLKRFANASLGHRTWQIAMDGSQKLPQRLLNTVRAQLRRGGPVAGLSLAVAAWMRYVLGRDEAGRPVDVRDPLAGRFAAIAAQGIGDVDELVGRFMSLQEIFGTDLASQLRFTSNVVAYLRQLMEKGAAATVYEFVSAGDAS